MSMAKMPQTTMISIAKPEKKLTAIPMTAPTVVRNTGFLLKGLVSQRITYPQSRMGMRIANPTTTETSMTDLKPTQVLDFSGYVRRFCHTERPNRVVMQAAQNAFHNVMVPSGPALDRPVLLTCTS